MGTRLQFCLGLGYGALNATYSTPLLVRQSTNHAVNECTMAGDDVKGDYHNF